MTNITRWLGNCAVWAIPALMVSAVHAAEFSLPAGAELTFEDLNDFERYALPVGPWSEGQTPEQLLTGQVLRQAWRFPANDATTLQMLVPLKGQLAEQGYQVLFECADRSCGGFDFRFDIEVLSSPEMYVDLTDFQFLSAAGPKREKFASLLVSKSAASAYVQIVQVLPEESSLPDVQSEAGGDAGLPMDLPSRLEAEGAVILSDLAFETGSSTLGDSEFESLRQLADYLLAHPSRSVALVGHTDAVGALDANIALSRKRAVSVMTRLKDAFGVPASQMVADGVGYLSPVSSNLTEAGRLANRRVEAVLTSTK